MPLKKKKKDDHNSQLMHFPIFYIFIHLKYAPLQVLHISVVTDCDINLSIRYRLASFGCALLAIPSILFLHFGYKGLRF